MGAGGRGPGAGETLPAGGHTPVTETIEIPLMTRGRAPRQALAHLLRAAAAVTREHGRLRG